MLTILDAGGCGNQARGIAPVSLDHGLQIQMPALGGEGTHARPAWSGIHRRRIATMAGAPVRQQIASNKRSLASR